MPAGNNQRLSDVFRGHRNGKLAWRGLICVFQSLERMSLPSVHFEQNVDNKAKGRISKRVFQENKARQIFRKKIIFFNPWYAHVSGGKKMSFLRKIWRDLFSWNTHFEIHPFALLPTKRTYFKLISLLGLDILAKFLETVISKRICQFSSYSIYFCPILLFWLLLLPISPSYYISLRDVAQNLIFITSYYNYSKLFMILFSI